MFRVKEFLAFFSKTIAERTEKGVRQSVEENGTKTLLEIHNARL